MAGKRPTVRRRRLAVLLVEFRERAGKTPDEAAERIGCHRTKINRIENARLGISLGELRDLLRFYGVEDQAQVDEMVALAQRSREPGWVQRVGLSRPTYADFIDYERTANYIRSFQSTVIAGLLQTPDYTRAIFTASPAARKRDQVEVLVESRMKRQEILERPDPPRLCVILGEAALRVQVGGRTAMRKQLDHLETMADHRAVQIQVIPDRAGAYAAIGTPFVLFTFPGQLFPDVACVEHRTGMLHLDDPEETADYTLIFDTLRSVALSPEDSLDKIAQVRQEM